MEQQKREFTGVWIPKHIIEDTNLKPVDRLIYAEVSCFEVCTMTNATLGERAGCSEPTASRSIAKLKDKGYVSIIGFNGRIRKMISLTDNPIVPNQIDKAASSKEQGSLIKLTKQPNQIDVEDNTIENKEKTKENNIAEAIGETPKVYGKAYINEAFDYWEEVIGYKLESNSKSNRNACSNLIKKHGLEGVKRLIGGVAKANEDKFAPRISDFTSLQFKYNDLIAWGKRQQNNQSTSVVII